MNLVASSSDRSADRNVFSTSGEGRSQGVFRFPIARKRILLLGWGPLSESLAEMLRGHRKLFTNIVGVLVQDNQIKHDFKQINVLGTISELVEVVDRHRVDTIVVCLEDRRAVLPVTALLSLKSLGINIVDGHQLYESESGRIPIDELKPSALIFGTGFRRGFVVTVTKRFIDILVSALGLVLLLPVMMVVAAMIKLDSPGPIFYRQVRVGLGAKPYMIWKFRSMFLDAEKSGPRWASEDDPRISRVGCFLRRFRIDEIPQLFNVLLGQMSLVGPRPERPIFVEQLRSVIPYYDLRHTVRPGITGWAQTRFRYGSSTEDSHVKLQYDLYYVKHLSIGLDIRILVDTLRVMLCGYGAR